MLALGVDSGGTHTRCLVIDEHGHLIGYGVSGASKPDAVPPEIGRANLQQAIQAACAPCGVDRIDTVFVGMGGIVSEHDAQVGVAMLDGAGWRAGVPIGIDHDLRIALAGGAAGQPGVALIVGTGSSAYGRSAAGESWRSGGWGYIMDDLGSGFYLGQQALMAVTRVYDGREHKQTPLTQPILEALEIANVNDLMHRIYYPRLDHAGIAALAPIVVRLAEDGDRLCSDIIRRGCLELAYMVVAVVNRLKLGEAPLVIPVGGLATESAYFRHRLNHHLTAAVAKVRIQDAVASPVVGAAFLALEQIGMTLNEAQLCELDTKI